MVNQAPDSDFRPPPAGLRATFVAYCLSFLHLRARKNNLPWLGTKSNRYAAIGISYVILKMDKLSPEFANSGSPSDLPVTDFSGESRPGCHVPRNNPYESNNMNSFLNPPYHNQTAPFPSIPQGGNNTYWRFNLPENGNGNGNEDGNSIFPSGNCTGNNKQNSMAAMREMIFRIAAMQPIYIDPESVKPPKRRNVKISKDPQSVAARHRRERISERIRILQRLVPGGTKMDTASMLDEAIHYVKFLKTQVQSLERAAVNRPPPQPVHGGVSFPVVMSTAAANEGAYFPVMKGYPVMQNGEGSQAQGFSSDG